MSRTYAAPEPRQWAPFALRPIFPVDPPSASVLGGVSVLPTYKPPSDFGHQYTRSTHIFPAAWPRSTPFMPIPPETRAPAGESKEAKKARAKRITQDLLALKERHENGEMEGKGSEKILCICVNRYARKGVVVAGGKTVICAHANGMHKVRL